MTIFGLDLVAGQVARVFRALEHSGPVPPETAAVDYKEEAGRRDTTGGLGRGLAQSEDVARQVAGEAACMANSDGGGAIILGLSDTGALCGAEVDADWLRHRVYELTDRRLTVSVSEQHVRQTRLLVITAPQALEPLRWNGRITWRVGDHCVEVDASTWHEMRMRRLRYDWSDDDSGLPVSRVRELAVEQAREFLRQSNEDAAMELAAASTPELLRRLNVVTHGGGSLTRAGALAFIGPPGPALDYIRRDVAGGDSTHRIRASDLSLVEAVAQVVRQAQGYNRVQHVGSGLSRGQVTQLPRNAVREAVVNGVVHRDWADPAPTVIEHVGSSLVVTSPGGFVGGVNRGNIITHPSAARNRALAELFASLRIAEREGVGVDRMVRDMLRLGHAAPDIDEIEGPCVRTALVGDAVDEPWMEWLAGMQPAEAGVDLQIVMLLRQLVDTGWVDTRSAQPLLQLSGTETMGAIRRLAQVSMEGQDVLRPVAGIPDDSPVAYQLSKPARAALLARDTEHGRRRRTLRQREVAVTWARHRGRISSTDLASILGAASSNMSGVLKDLEADGHLVPSRVSRRGRGFYYRWHDIPHPTGS